MLGITLRLNEVVTVKRPEAPTAIGSLSGSPVTGGLLLFGVV